MARQTNKKAALKKRCNELENNIKQSMTFRKEHELSNSASKKLTGFNYHAKALELDTAQTRGHAVNYAYDAIADVRVNAYDFIDDAFCELHGLPLLDRFDELTDAQALFISLVIRELYPDIDDVVETNPNVAELLMPALARDKLTKARDAISLDNFEDAGLLLEEVGQIAEMIIVVHQYLNPAPYKAVVVNKKQHNEKVSNVRSESVKRTERYGFSQELKKLVVDYAESVKALLQQHEMPMSAVDVTFFGVKGLDLHSWGENEEFILALSNLAFEFEEKYEALYTAKKGDEDEIFISLATIRRHLVDIVSSHQAHNESVGLEDEVKTL
ncbi:hypothetical protein A9259_20100 [Vibrio cyclitrophicus]|uniref:hypothetical protein n=1 Tax=Vibrio cyclitrophicus TaxID=47951 RepID=UPI0007EE9500|nr:hypothetical protein [Vibrio cyclitrophicus]OBT01612.1 hypothetical protein A9259_20100 [Vibrio cyclitrophicus]